MPRTKHSASPHPLLATAVTHHQKGELVQAEKLYRQILHTQPKNFDALHMLGVVHLAHRDYLQGEHYIRSALAIRKDAFAWNHLGNALKDQNQTEAAIACYEAALAIKADHVTALNNLGNALRDLNKIDGALDCYRRAQKINPHYVDAQWNEALALLVNGEFVEGWHKYETRWQRAELAPQLRTFTSAAWSGSEDLHQRSILMYAEQGLGDCIQFIRYAELLHARGARVLLEAPKVLHSLFSALPSLHGIFSRDEERPECDYHIPLLSLPRAFNTQLHSIPASIPYLVADSTKREFWKTALPDDRPKIGVVWAGAADHNNDRNRSIPLSIFQALFKTPAYQFISLQKEIKASDLSAWNAVHTSHANFTNAGRELHDFSDTAAVVSMMDKIITVDTSVAHLAGALGKETWLLLPFAPDWRWLLERTDSPWYPTMRLFRQTQTGDWGSVLSEITRILHRPL